MLQNSYSQFLRPEEVDEKSSSARIPTIGELLAYAESVVKAVDLSDPVHAAHRAKLCL